MNWNILLTNNVINEQLLRFVLKLLLSALLGTLLGLEGTLKNTFAGVRTHLIISCASCLISACGEDVVALVQTTGADAGRLAGQILTGVGFVGAGVIIRRVSGVTTTAATIFCAAAVGIGCGLGFFAYSIMTTAIIVLGINLGYRFFPLEEVAGKSVKLVCKESKMNDLMQLLGKDCRLNEVQKRAQDVEFKVFFRSLSWAQLDKLIEELGEHPDVLSVQLVDGSFGS